MIITISGKLGSGKSTVAKLLSKKLNLKHYSTGDFMRQIAEEEGITLIELNKIAETEHWVDKELDDRQIKIGKTEDNFIIDGRLAWHFIPKSLKIYLDVSDDVAAKRIWNDKENRKKEGFESFESLKKELKQRKESEIIRYKQKYNLNHHDKSNYDLVIDTTDLNPDLIINEIIEFIKKTKKSL